MRIEQTSLVDIEAIRQLTFNYGFYSDTGDADGFANTFTDPCNYDQSLCDSRVPTCRSPKEVKELYLGFKPQQVGGLNGGGGVHIVTNNRITSIEGDTATGTCYFVARGVSTTGAASEWVGYYDDKYARVHGEWKFSERVFRPLLPINSGDLDF